MSVATVAIFYAVGSGSNVEDTSLALALVIVMAVGLFGSLVAFLLAIVARIWIERWAWLRLPFSVFPAIMAFLVLGEAFLWE